MKLFGPQREILLLTFIIETWVTSSVVAGLDRCPNRPTSHGEKSTGRKAVSEVRHWNKSHAKDTTSHQQPILQSFVQLWQVTDIDLQAKGQSSLWGTRLLGKTFVC